MNTELNLFQLYYQDRLALSAVLFNTWYAMGIDVIKSKLYSDGTAPKDCFIVMARLSTGKQISYHYKLEYWNRFKVQELDRAYAHDGHTPQDVINALLELTE